MKMLILCKGVLGRFNSGGGVVEIIFCTIPSAGAIRAFGLMGVCLLGSRKNRMHHIVSVHPIYPVIGWIRNSNIVTDANRKTKIHASLFIGTRIGLRMSFMDIFSIILG